MELFGTEAYVGLSVDVDRDDNDGYDNELINAMISDFNGLAEDVEALETRVDEIDDALSKQDRQTQGPSLAGQGEMLADLGVLAHLRPRGYPRRGGAVKYPDTYQRVYARVFPALTVLLERIAGALPLRLVTEEGGLYETTGPISYREYDSLDLPVLHARDVTSPPLPADKPKPKRKSS
jgi:hypothetical protein